MANNSNMIVGTGASGSDGLGLVWFAPTGTTAPTDESGALNAALKDDTHREAALITFLVTLSGVVIAGVGSAFWGVVAGGVALLVQHYGRKPAAT